MTFISCFFVACWLSCAFKINKEGKVFVNMAHLYADVDEISPYLKARKKFYTTDAWDKMIEALKTVKN